MVTCVACLRRASLPLFPNLSAVNRLGRHAEHSTWASIQKGHHVREIRKNLKRASRPGRITSGKNATAYSKKISKPVQRTLRSRVANNNTYDLTMSLEPERKENETLTKDESKSRALREIQYLRDPHRLADHVQGLLRHGEVQAAYDLILTSQKEGLRNIVSWNHLIDYHMSKGMFSDALKYYNQMKKRGTRPDSHTYTIMLRGLAQNRDDQESASQALSIYTSMTADNSIAKPTIIHHNCMLNVCNKTGDMDTLFGIAGGMPETGPNSPDAWSYAIILSALMGHVHKLKTMFEKGDKERNAAITRAMMDGRKLWEDVVRRWRAGEVAMDESLVSAMASLLQASGRDSDAKDVFSLVQQTMNIPQPQSLPISNADAVAESEMQGREEPEAALMSSNASPPFTGFVKPGNFILSYLLRTAYQMRSRKIGDFYWNRFVQPDVGLEIDFRNLCDYLRLLSLSHASTRTVQIFKLFQKEPAKFPTNGVARPPSYPFFLAMEACRRDKNSQHAFANADAIFEIMQTVLPEPDPKILREYLLVARITTPGLPTYSPAGQKNSRRERARMKFDSNPSRNHLIRALRRVVPDALKLRDLVEEAETSVPDPFNPVPSSSNKDEKAAQQGAIRDERTRLLAQDIERDCTRLIAKGLAEKEEEELDELRQRAMAWLKRWDKLEWKRKLVEKMRPVASPMDATVREKGKGEKKLRMRNDGKDNTSDRIDSERSNVADRALRRSEIGDRSSKKEKAKTKEKKFKSDADEPVQPDWGAGWADFAERTSPGNTKAWVTA